MGDLHQLVQLFLNLLNNALKYSDMGGYINVIAKAVHDEIQVAIWDTGIGIGAEHVPHLFDRFYRADSSRARQTGGNGLGLAIANAIAHQHHGRISVESTLGAGSTFTVYLPLTTLDAGKDMAIYRVPNRVTALGQKVN